MSCQKDKITKTSLAKHSRIFLVEMQPMPRSSSHYSSMSRSHKISLNDNDIEGQDELFMANFVCGYKVKEGETTSCWTIVFSLLLTFWVLSTMYILYNLWVLVARTNFTRFTKFSNRSSYETTSSFLRNRELCWCMVQRVTITGIKI